MDSPLAHGVQLRPAERAGLRAAFVVLGLMIAAAAAYAASGGGSGWVDHLMRNWLPSAVYVLAAGVVVVRAVRIRERRGAWILIAVGLSLYGLGNLLWSLWLQNLASPPIPSVSDGLWLSLYPASYVGLVLLARRRGTNATAGVWLDGIVAGLGIATLGAAVVVAPVLNSATGPFAAVATNLAYPVGDLLLAALVMGVLGLRGFRLDRVWALLGGGFLLLCVADIMVLMQLAGGGSSSSIVANVFYLCGVLAIAVAAWQPASSGAAPSVQGWSMLVVPGAFALAAIGLLIYDHFIRVHPVTLALSILTLLAALLRTALSFRYVQEFAENRRQATTDDLTSLPNRRLLLERVEAEISEARGSADTPALLIIDLDHFKELNDTLGHRAGDLLLRQIGPRLQATIRSTDMLARLGGDEFGMLLGVPCDESEAVRAAGEIRRVLREPFVVEGLHLTVAASVGIALFPEHGLDGDQLLQRADIAMYQAKVARTGHQVYARERDRTSRDNLALASELPRAVARGELEVHFQPQAESGTRRIAGVEALVRWRHPIRGLIPPVEFLPLAEQGGMAREITRCVLAEALGCTKRWRAVGHPLEIAVNVFVADLLDVDFPLEVAAALAAHGVPAEALTIEVTESSVLSDPDRIGAVLRRLGELGVGISLDDYGTGYSSLSHLRTLPVREVKLDRSFVSGMRSEAADAAIVRSTIALAHTLGMRVVAEGVEDEATWELLAGLGCERIQGYHLARPLSTSDLDELLEISRGEQHARPGASVN
ncbi:MAG: hypothetical protein QOG59_3449 [Solirubrobacteraceae bacterium]|nr:hypothetical protein [Solirubrobacteraceae bacterium]